MLIAIKLHYALFHYCSHRQIIWQTYNFICILTKLKRNQVRLNRLSLWSSPALESLKISRQNKKEHILKVSGTFRPKPDSVEVYAVSCSKLLMGNLIKKAHNYNLQATSVQTPLFGIEALVCWGTYKCASVYLILPG